MLAYALELNFFHLVRIKYPHIREIQVVSPRMRAKSVRERI